MLILYISIIVFILLSLIITLLLIFIPTFIGFRSPPAFTIKKTKIIKANKNIIFYLLTNYKKFPMWRKNLKFVDIEELPSKKTKVLEYYKHFKRIEEYTVVRYVENVVFSILKLDREYTSLWSFELESIEENVTSVTIKETLYVYNGYLRFMLKYILKNDIEKEIIFKRLKDALNRR